ncbi:peptidylprolyl isomerase [Ferrimonas pelagia]|uniref:Peptidyl-prolyl cis-trans isomerase n=1 Tax=Ferrimonas pelagia TaxID=1177826 RepID=A0ABP9EZV7_9GAMM
MKKLLPLLLIPALSACQPTLDTPLPASDLNVDQCFTLSTRLGEILLAVDTTQTPETGANFIRYADEGYYDGTLFHRVIDGFMVQAGGFSSGLERKETHAPIVNEGQAQLHNVRGTLAMARTNHPDSATAQFFINSVDNQSLNTFGSRAGYAVFGQVLAGMAVVDAISSVDTHRQGMHGDVPVEEIAIDALRPTRCPKI